MSEKTNQSNNTPPVTNVVVGQMPISVVDPHLIRKDLSYKETLHQALMAVLFAFVASLPFTAILVIIGFSHIDVTSAADTSQQNLVDNVGSIVIVLAGAIYFARKTKLLSGFFAFIISGMAAAIPYIALRYIINSQSISGVVTFVASIAIFAVFIVLLTKLAISRYRVVSLSIIGIPLLLALVFINHYYSVHGKTIKSQQNIDRQLGGVNGLNYQFYAPTLGQWTYHDAGIYAEDPGLQDHQILNIYMDDRSSDTVLQLDEGTNQNDVFGIGPGPSDCTVKQFSKTLKGRPIFANSCDTPDQTGYIWAATKIGNVYIIADVSSIDNVNYSQPLSYFSKLVDSLGPISKTQLSNELLRHRT